MIIIIIIIKGAKYNKIAEVKLVLYDTNAIT